MSRREHFFHGSNVDMDTVLPTRAGGGVAHSSSHRNMARRMGGPYDPYEHAHVSERENPAWYFAGRAADNGGGRSRVFTTGAAADQRMGLEHRRNPDSEVGDPNHHEWVSKTGFPVTGRVDVQPPETIRKPGKHMRYHPNPAGRQGTLPLDWRQHMAGPYNGDTQANHPTGALIKGEQARIQHAEEERAGTRGPRQQARWGKTDGIKLEHPPMYQSGVKVSDEVSEKVQRSRGGQPQPMLPGMRGTVKRKRK